MKNATEFEHRSYTEELSIMSKISSQKLDQSKQYQVGLDIRIYIM